MDPLFSSLHISAGSSSPFGATDQSNGINFAIYIKGADQVSLCFFNESSYEEPAVVIGLDPLHHKTGEVWHALVQGLPPYAIYCFQVKQHGTSESYLLLDPYAKAVASDPNWSEHPTIGDTLYLPRGKVIPNESSFDWEDDTFPRIPMNDLILYEMHIRGFTRHPSSGAKHPGTYAGVIEKIPYLQQLGVNAVEIMPVHEFNEKEVELVCPYNGEKLHNYWGYSPVSYFAPMNRYASKSSRDEALIEFKTMVKEFHRHGIEVILDVVFNHTSEGNEKGPIQSFKGLDRNAYYMIDPHGRYLNFSGCGNTVNSNHPLVIDLIVRALRHWVEEMHVDGFRFDLASIMTRGEDGVPMAHPPLVEAVAKDPILSGTKLIAEAWDAAGLYQVGAFMPKSLRWFEWNGKYRDVVRRFMKGTPGYKTSFATALCGSQDLYGIGRAPYCSVNYITAHDGFSLADLVTYNMKHNYGNGEGNRDGFDYNDSWNCGMEGHTSNKKMLFLREKQMRNFHLALMISQGVPMLLMGDEYAHTRDGNNNAWCQDNEINWFLWDRFEKCPGFNRFYRKLIELRKKIPLFRREKFLNEEDITWHGLIPNNPDWGHDNQFVAFTLEGRGKCSNFYAAFNASAQAQTVALPNSTTGWFWLVNTANETPKDFFEEPQPVEGQTIKMASYSSLLLVSGSQESGVRSQ